MFHHVGSGLYIHLARFPLIIVDLVLVNPLSATRQCTCPWM